MKTIEQTVQLTFRYAVHFTRDLFAPDNPLLRDVIAGGGPGPHRTLVVIDRGVARRDPTVTDRVEAYGATHAAVVELACPPLGVAGGEAAKNDPGLVPALHELISDAGLCRHSYVVAVGGGGLLDAVGYAAATAHRGLRLVRVPTTTLAQADSAVALQTGVNSCGKKNFVGTFAPPFAVLNDVDFLGTLSARDWRAGLAEAVKVAVVRDAAFFEVLESSVGPLADRDVAAMQAAIHRCAELHGGDIAGDAFGSGAARPLAFGHWAAHRLEALSDFRLRHGEAVAIGVALDTTYSYLSGLLAEADWLRVIAVLAGLGFALAVPELGWRLDAPDHPLSLLRGLEEFRAHLGGRLTVPLLRRIGDGAVADRIRPALVRRSVGLLEAIDARHARVREVPV